jgi:IMP dehydrogenase
MQEGSKDRYFQDVEDDVKKPSSRRYCGSRSYKGELNESMQQFIGGLVPEWANVVQKISTLQDTGRFVRITASGLMKVIPIM